MKAINLFIDLLVTVFIRKQIEKQLPHTTNAQVSNAEYDRQKLERIYNKKSSEKC